MATTERLSHEEREKRRRAMAEAVTDAASLARVAAEHGVTLETVRAACRIYAPQKLGSYVPPPPARTARRRPTSRKRVA